MPDHSTLPVEYEQEVIKKGIQRRLFWASSMEIVSPTKIRYYEATLKRSIPKWAASKNFSIVILDILEGTLSFCRNYPDPGEEPVPDVVVQVSLGPDWDGCGMG